jgi:hypothetical protein
VAAGAGAAVEPGDLVAEVAPAPADGDPAPSA